SICVCLSQCFVPVPDPSSGDSHYTRSSEVAHRSPWRRPFHGGGGGQNPVSSPDRRPCGRQGLEALLDGLIRAGHDRGAEPLVRRGIQESPALFLPAAPTASPDGYNPASSRRA